MKELKLTPSLEFTAPAKNIQQAVQKVVGVTQFVDCLDTERKHIFLVKGKNAYVVGITPDSFACVIIEGSSVEKQGALIFETQIVNGLIKGRDEVTISCDKAGLSIKAVKGKYNATTSIENVDEAYSVRIQDAFSPSKSKSFSSEIIKIIRAGIKSTQLTNFYSDEVILSYVQVTEKSVSIACADNFHVAHYKKKAKSGSTFRFAIPTKTFSLIDKFIGESDAQFSLASQQLRVQGEGFIVSLPETQVDEDMFSLVTGYIKGLTSPTHRLVFNAEAMKTVDNMFAIITEDTKMSMQIGTKSVKVQLQTRSGTVNDAFKADVTGDAKTVHIDPLIFDDLFKKITSKSVPMEFFSGKKGTSSSFKIESQQDGATLTQIGTFYDE